jgi:hypothetical protein
VVNRHRSNWSAMGSSKFEFDNGMSLDERNDAREVVYNRFKEKLLNDFRETVKEHCKQSDLVKIDSLIHYGLQVLIEEFR